MLSTVECSAYGCRTLVVPWSRWQPLNEAERNRARAEGYNQLKAKGLCLPCYTREYNEGLEITAEQHANNVAGLENWLARRRERNNDC